MREETEFVCVFVLVCLCVSVFSLQVRFVIIGNKCDLEEEQRVVSYSEAKKYAENKGMKYFETSAKSGDGVKFALDCIVLEWMKSVV